MSTRRGRVAAGAALLLLAGCGVSTQGAPVRVDDDDVPFELLSPSTTLAAPDSVPQEAALLSVCFHRGTTVESVHRLGAQAGVDAALGFFLGGPRPEEAANGLSTAVFDPAIVLGARETGGIATVALSPTFTEAGAQVQLDIIVELVCTLTAQPGVGQVAFELGGERVDVPRGDGSLTDAPVSREDYPQLIG